MMPETRMQKTVRKAVEKETRELRWKLRWAWFQLGCRCMFDDAHNKIAEDAHCPVHGVYLTRNSFIAWNVPL